MEDEKAATDLATIPFQAPGPVQTGRSATLQTAFSGLIPTSIGEAYTLAGYLAKSSAIPKSYRLKPDTILTVILAGLEIGLTPIRSLNNLTNISGNLGMKADLQLALVRRSGLLEFYDEGFETKGQSDTDLTERTKDGAKILSLVKTVPDGKPYGWATAQRRGAGESLTTRTFTWSDAETAIVSEMDDDGGERKRLKLSEKFNYKSFPADMYPKRARGRVLQVTHSDVLAGILSSEALEDGQVFDAEILPPAGDSLESLMDGIEIRPAIDLGFDALEFSPARRLQKAVEYKGRPGDLLVWLRDEYAQRAGKGKGGTARKAAAAAQTMNTQAAPAEPPAPAPAEPPAPADAIPEKPIAPALRDMRDGDIPSKLKAVPNPAPPAATVDPDPATDPGGFLVHDLPVIPAAAKTATKPANRAAAVAAKFRERFFENDTKRSF